MERFKVCEKETKTKAFSKEGLAQVRTSVRRLYDACRHELVTWVCSLGCKEGSCCRGSRPGVCSLPQHCMSPARRHSRLHDDGDGPSLASLLRLMLNETGYEAMLTASKEDGEGSSRWRNLGELANLASERAVWELDDFLDQIALVSDVDALDGHGQRPREHGVRGLVHLFGIESPGLTASLSLARRVVAEVGAVE